MQFPVFHPGDLVYNIRVCFLFDKPSMFAKTIKVIRSCTLVIIASGGLLDEYAYRTPGDQPKFCYYSALVCDSEECKLGYIGTFTDNNWEICGANVNIRSILS